jgi:predicted transcriptional regulator
MDIHIPGADQVRAALAPLTLRQLDRLAELSGVPATTIYKIKRGETENPGIETLRKFVPHISAASAPPAQPEAAQQGV